MEEWKEEKKEWKEEKKEKKWRFFFLTSSLTIKSRREDNLVLRAIISLLSFSFPTVDEEATFVGSVSSSFESG